MYLRAMFKWLEASCTAHTANAQGILPIICTGKIPGPWARAGAGLACAGRVYLWNAAISVLIES